MTHPLALSPTAAGAPSPLEHPAHRLRSLDAIRGIAAMLVVLGHVFEELGASSPDGEAGPHGLDAVAVDYCNFGRVGGTFFLLSGYVMPFSFSHERPLPSFFVTRFFRLFPAYWLSVALALFVSGKAVPPARLLANLAMVQKLFARGDLLGVYLTPLYKMLFFCAARGGVRGVRYVISGLPAGRGCNMLRAGAGRGRAADVGYNDRRSAASRCSWA